MGLNVVVINVCWASAAAFSQADAFESTRKVHVTIWSQKGKVERVPRIFRDRNPDLVQEKVHRAGHSCRNPPLSTMHSRVHVGEYVLLRLPSDTLKLVHVVPNRYDLHQSLAFINAIG